MGSVATCSKCNAKNRLREGDERRPRCGRCQSDLPWLIDATDASFEREIETHSAILVDLWAPWCGPCRRVAPALEALASDLAGRLKIIKINVDHNPRLAAQFQARSIPMLVILKNGQVRQTLLGAQSKIALRQAVEPFL